MIICYLPPIKGTRNSCWYHIPPFFPETHRLFGSDFWWDDFDRSQEFFFWNILHEKLSANPWKVTILLGIKLDFFCGPPKNRSQFKMTFCGRWVGGRSNLKQSTNKKDPKLEWSGDFGGDSLTWISHEVTWDIWGLKPTYILTLDPNFRPGHPSTKPPICGVTKPPRIFPPETASASTVFFEELKQGWEFCEQFKIPSVFCPRIAMHHDNVGVYDGIVVGLNDGNIVETLL